VASNYLFSGMSLRDIPIRDYSSFHQAINRRPMTSSEIKYGEESTLVREIFIYSYAIEEVRDWAERMESLGFDRMPDEKGTFQHPLTFDQIEEMFESDKLQYN
jgi:hypothetical protein